MKKIWLYIMVLAFASACEPYQEDDIDIGDLPEAPSFTFEYSTENPNMVTFTDVSTGFFARQWSFEGGFPATATDQQVEIMFPNMGDWVVTLNAVKSGGSGTSFSTQVVNILEDAPITCDDNRTFLAGGCEDNDIKCWTFTYESGAITVGPVEGSAEWFSSTAGSLQIDQYDDRFCFQFNGSAFTYNNNGLTVNPWAGYEPQPFDSPAEMTWALQEGGSWGGNLHLVLPEGAFIGVRDSGPNYDIIELTENRLILRSPLVDESGNVVDGFFDLILEEGQ